VVTLNFTNGVTIQEKSSNGFMKPLKEEKKYCQITPIHPTKRIVQENDGARYEEKEKNEIG